MKPGFSEVHPIQWGFFFFFMKTWTIPKCLAKGVALLGRPSKSILPSLCAWVSSHSSLVARLEVDAHLRVFR